MMKRSAVITTLACAVFCAPAPAGFSITIEEIGSDVVLSGSGSLDLSLWGPPSAGLNTQDPFIDSAGLLTASNGAMLHAYADEPASFSGPGVIALDGGGIPASSWSGDPLLFFWATNAAQIHVPLGYSFGAPLTTGMVFENQSLASLGLEIEIYLWTWDTKDGGSDFYSISVLPTPGALAMLGAAGLLGPRRRRAD